MAPEPIHHRRSIRLPEFDYGSPAAYFVTICTQNRRCLLGRVVEETMVLSEAGEVVARQWVGLSDRFSHVQMDMFVVMPNHIHGVVVLTPKDAPSGLVDIATANKDLVAANPPGEHRVRPYGDGDSLTRRGDHGDLPSRDGEPRVRWGEPRVRPDGVDGACGRGTKARSLGRMVQALKSLTTVSYGRGIMQNGWPPYERRLWQRNPWERVLRDHEEWERARQYIQDNPRRWHLDRQHPDNLVGPSRLRL